MGFPHVKFGKCERCGRGGNEIDSDGVSSAGTGYELKEYEGKYLCQLCINYLEDLKHSQVVTELDGDEQKFRDQAGVEKA